MSLMQVLGGIGSAAAGLNTADDIYQLGADANQQMADLSDNLKADTAFTGYGVQTGLGNSTVDAMGNTNIGVGPDAGMMGGGQQMMQDAQSGMTTAIRGLGDQNAVNDWMRQGAQQMAPGFNQTQNMMGQAMGASQQAMQNAMQDTAGREQDIYNRTMAMQQPGLDAQRASQQAREFAQGRGGVRGSQFGGTAEDAATARAQAQAQNQASFQAMNQAQQEMMNQGALASQFGGMGLQAGAQNQNAANQLAQLGVQTKGMTDARLGMMGQLAQGAGQLGQNMYQTSFLPMQQQMAAMQLGGQNADRFQSGQFTGANLGAQLGLGGIQSQINAAKTGTELEGNIYAGAMNALSGMNQGLLGTDLFTENPNIGQRILDAII